MMQIIHFPEIRLNTFSQPYDAVREEKENCSLFF